MIAQLNPHDPSPPVDRALGPESEAFSLLAANAEPSSQRLLITYRQGIFPWHAQGQLVLWRSTNPRAALRPEDFHISATSRKTLRRMPDDPAWEIRINRGFQEMMVAYATTACPGQHGTWITEGVIQACTSLHHRGYTHSIETRYAGERVGGSYGVALGRMLYGESILARCTDTSRIALAALCAFLSGQGVAMIDCQQETEHLASLGGAPISRAASLAHVREAANTPVIVP